MNPTNLYEYYQGQGQNLPTVQERAPLYAQYGGQGSYTGSAQQNQFLLGQLQGGGQQNQMGVGSGPARSQFMQQSSNLQNLLNQFNTANPQGVPGQGEGDINVDTYQDPYTQALTQQAQQGDQYTKALIGSLQARNQGLKNEMAGQYDSYKRGLQLLGIQTNSAQSTPDLLMGHIQQAQNEYTSKIQNLNQEEAFTIMEAENARADKNLSLLKEKMDYVKEIKKEKQNALKEAYERMSLEADVSKEQVGLYYDKMQTLNDEDKEDFLIAISKKFNIPLPGLVKAMSDEASARQISSEDRAYELSKRKKDLSGGGDGGYTEQEKRKLRQAGIDPTDIEAADNFLYGDEGDGDPFADITPAYEGEELKKMTNHRKKKLLEEGVAEGDIKEVKSYLNKGFSLEQIAKATGMPNNIYNKFKKYIK